MMNRIAHENGLRARKNKDPRRSRWSESPRAPGFGSKDEVR